jgi:hypothetical protein
MIGPKSVSITVAVKVSPETVADRRPELPTKKPPDVIVPPSTLQASPVTNMTNTPRIDASARDAITEAGEQQA